MLEVYEVGWVNQHGVAHSEICKSQAAVDMVIERVLPRLMRGRTIFVCDSKTGQRWYVPPTDGSATVFDEHRWRSS
jgi:hypothetical protein